MWSKRYKQDWKREKNEKNKHRNKAIWWNPTCMTLEKEKSWTWIWTSKWNFGQSYYRDRERKSGSEERLRGEVWELPFKRDIEPTKTATKQHRESSYQKKNGAEGREIERAEREREKYKFEERKESVFFSLGIIVILKSQLGYFCKIRFYKKEKTPIFKKPQFVLYYCRVQARFIVVNLGWFDR